MARRALYSPDAVAFDEYESGASYTYRDADAIANRLARMLADDWRIAAGDRVAALAANSVEHIFLFIALQRLGAILVPVNYRLSPREIRHILSDCEPALLIHERRYDETAAAAGDEIPRMHFDGPDSLTAAAHGTSRPSGTVSAHPDFDTPVMILYTAGTTGAPKGAVVTHGMLFWNSVNTLMRLNLTERDVTPAFAPFFHTGGWNVLTTPFLHLGARSILLKKFDPDLVLRLCEERAVTILFGVPTMMDMMHRSPSFATARLDTVRYAIVGGEPMPLDLIRAWQDKGVPIRQGYGLTEFGPNVFSLNEADAIRKIGSIGFPNFYIDAKVVDDAGRELADGQVGEMWLRGPVCTPGYWRNPEATAAAITDGWFHTGDMVRRDAEGYFYVVDRKKDMYISGAENVYPAEVEAFLRTHPKVQAVAVVGVPDAKWGEVGRAFVVPKPGETATEEEILAFCAGNLAKYKIPRRVVFLDALPVSDAGKILKRTLKDLT